MDLRQKPTLMDLAKMLDAIDTTSDAIYPGTLRVLQWLIESSPAACEIYDRLHARRDREPSLIELARLVIAVENAEPYPDAVFTLTWLIGRSAKASELYRQLEQLADDVGFQDRDHGWALEALKINAEVDRLLATLDDWQDANEAIELNADEHYALQFLLTICRARIARSEGDEQARLERLRRRLQDAARRKIRVEAPEERLRELQGVLRSMDDPESVLATVEKLRHQRRSE